MDSGLQNEDFRALLNSLCEEKGNKGLKEKREKIEQTERKRKKREKEKKRDNEENKEETTEKEKDKEKKKEKPKYRNRAEERRRGIIKDIEDETILYNNKDNTIDESKFMGGDVEHTHLVKGLDYMLLKRVRADLNHGKEEQASFITFGEEKNKKHEKYFFDSENNNINCKQIYKYFFLLEHPHQKDFKTKVQNISDSIIEKNMKFQHYNRSIHNTFYKCNLDMEIEANDIPPKYIVEREETPRITTYYLGKDYVNEIGDCFKWHAENKKKKKEERLTKRTSRFLKNHSVEEEDSADIDIFAKDNNEENSSSADDKDDRVEMDSSQDSSSSDDNDVSSVNKRIKTQSDETPYIADTEKAIQKRFGNLSHNTKFDLTNNVETKGKDAFKNAFKDTYDECYPL